MPTVLAEMPAEVIVVDYACPQNTAQWVKENHPSVKVVNVTDDPGFCVARGRNLGAAVASSDWLVFIDADIKVTPGWLAWMRENLRSRSFFRAGRQGGRRDPESYGTVIVERAAFNSIGGYDEVFRGWGGEDDDLYKRLVVIGVTDSEYPRTFVSVLSHDDAERLTFHDIKEKDIHHVVNQCYIQAKFQAMNFYGFGNNLGIELRQQFMSKIKSSIIEWHEAGSGAAHTINLEMKGEGWLPSPYTLEKVLHFSLRVVIPKNS